MYLGGLYSCGSCTVHFRKQYFSEDIPDIEDIWTSSFIDQIPQLDGAGDKDPPPSTCQLLRYSQYTLFTLCIFFVYKCKISL